MQTCEVTKLNTNKLFDLLNNPQDNSERLFCSTLELDLSKSETQFELKYHRDILKNCETKEDKIKVNAIIKETEELLKKFKE